MTEYNLEAGVDGDRVGVGITYESLVRDIPSIIEHGGDAFDIFQGASKGGAVLKNPNSLGSKSGVSSILTEAFSDLDALDNAADARTSSRGPACVCEATDHAHRHTFQRGHVWCQASSKRCASF